MIQAQEGLEGKLRSGGDGPGAGEGLTVVPTRTVALFSGLVPVGADGRAEIPLTVPDFAGEMRVMAVAFSGGQVGESEAALTVRDAVVADLSLPRFLAPGDEAFATLLVDNVEGKAGTYTAKLKTSGAVTEAEVSTSFELGPGQRGTAQLPLSGGEIGFGTVNLALTGPSDLALERDWPIEVRPSQPRVAQQTLAQLGPGETLTLPAERFDGFIPDTARLSVSLGFRPRVRCARFAPRSRPVSLWLPGANDKPGQAFVGLQRHGGGDRPCRR